MSFLPTNYKAPASTGNYMKLQDGDNMIRILSEPILGWEDWDNKKPIRYKFDNKPMNSVDPEKPIKHFWAMIVWNYVEEEIQILQITQAGIRKAIESLSNDESWGAPYFYDIKITKEGKELKTKYSVNPRPHKKLDPRIKEAFLEKPCSLNALFSNGDPFNASGNYTNGIFEKDIKADEVPF